MRLRQGARRLGSFAGTCMVTLLVGVTLAAIFVAPAQTAQPRTIHVDDDAVPGGSGTASAPYNNLADAVAAAGTTSAAVVIKVAPGDYAIASTLVIDRPLELRGSSVLIDDADGWPTGDVAAGTETRVFASNALPQLVRVGRGDASVISDVTIRGFVFDGTSTDISMWSTRVQDYWVADNVFRGSARLGFLSVASSGRATGNYATGARGAGLLFLGGYPTSPSNVVVQGNRSVGNINGGMVLNGASISIPELGDQLNATVRDNDLSGQTGPEAVGLRLYPLRRDIGAPGDSQSSGNIKALVADNRIQGNRIGIAIEAGFTYRRVGTLCDSRVYSGTIDVELADNTLAGNQYAPALVSFTKDSVAFSPATLPLWQYLHGATYTISDRDGELEDAWIDHPASDPFLGPCPGDATNEALGNVLIYNGVVLPNGKNF